MHKYHKIMLFTVFACLPMFHSCVNSQKLVYSTELPIIETETKINHNSNTTAEIPIESNTADSIPGFTSTPPPAFSIKELRDMDISNPKIVIEKSTRHLHLLDGDAIMASFKIGLGFTPEGAKTIQGDGKTPEGEYYVCYRNPNSKFYLSLGISYPNKDDAQKALDNGMINVSTYNKIVKAIDQGKIPPWNTSLGGEIMIHGNGSDSDWTAGCIAVDNELMDLLFEICDIGTPVTIS